MHNMKIEEFLDKIDPDDFKEDAGKPASASGKLVMPDSALISAQTIQALTGQPVTASTVKPVEQKISLQPIPQQPTMGFDGKTELQTLIAALELSIAKNDVAESMQIYAKLKQQSHKLSELDEQDRKQLYDRILKADNLLTGKLEEIERAAKITIQKISECVKNAQGQQTTKAMGEYERAQSMLETIPDVAANLKDEARALLLQLYLDILTIKLKDDQKTIALTNSQIMEDIVQARHLIQQAKYAEAKALYKKSLDQYQHLPRGYLKEKSVIYKTIIALFNEISFSEKMSTLQHLIKQEAKPQDSAPNILDAYILRAKYLIKEGKIEQAKKDLGYVLAKDPTNGRALAVKAQLDSDKPKPMLLDTRLMRLEYEASHGNKDAVLRELQELERKFPTEQKIVEIKKRVMSFQEKKTVESA